IATTRAPCSCESKRPPACPSVSACPMAMKPTLPPAARVRGALLPRHHFPGRNRSRILTIDFPAKADVVRGTRFFYPTMSQSPRRVTLSDIAKQAEVHVTTVSLALRNHPRLPERTRKRIQKIAEELGYQPDPVLQALVA